VIKPNYEEGTRVKFDLGDVRGRGWIRGLASSHIVDFWIVEVDDANIDGKVYPWSCITVQHTCIEEY
jgi:hypothetical protein